MMYVLKILNLNQNEQWVEGTPIPPELTAVCWCDGAPVQLNSMTNQEHILKSEENRMIVNKHAASCSAGQQPADLCPVFRSMKTLQSSASASDVPAFGLQQVINETREFLLSEIPSTFPTIFPSGTKIFQ